ncbi:hypothetical protein QQ045_011751 [Rhodiola kirilowii]
MSHIMKAEYFNSSNLWEACVVPKPSHAWRSIHKAKNLLKKSIFAGGNGAVLDRRVMELEDFSCRKVYTKSCWKEKAVWRELGLNWVDSVGVLKEPADWVWEGAFKLDPASFRLLVCGSWMLWNRLTMGLWGYYQLREDLRKLYVDGSFSREDK